ncbi:MAG TPA: hypothetical protein VEJ63_20395 [Planctomycetota bacterium]|nr:hypothetical protein [Planctomycetota bacterium]
MGQINFSNSNNRDAMVNTQTVRTPMRVRWLDEKGRQSQNVRLLRCTIDRDCDAMVAKAGALEKVAELLLKEDCEIDFENTGRFLSDTSRVYVDPDKKIVHKVQEWEIVKNIDGSVRERRPRKVALPNIATETPLRWSGRLMKKAEVYNRFVFVTKLQIVHINGLTYDFLYAMAKELEEKQSFLFVGSGPKCNQPIVLYRGGTQYRGFLEGRTQGDKYCLILHLSNMELKKPDPLPETAASLPTDNTKTPSHEDTKKEEKKQESAAVEKKSEPSASAASATEPAKKAKAAAKSESAELEKKPKKPRSKKGE